MTENEAIKRIKDHIEVYSRKERMAIYITVALGMAIKALEEVQEYRKIGTVEEVKEAVEKKNSIKAIKTKKFDIEYYKCPICGACLSVVEKYCYNCGQRLEKEAIELWNGRQ